MCSDAVSEYLTSEVQAINSTKQINSEYESSDNEYLSDKSEEDRGIV